MDYAWMWLQAMIECICDAHRAVCLLNEDCSPCAWQPHVYNTGE